MKLKSLMFPLQAYFCELDWIERVMEKKVSPR